MKKLILLGLFIFSFSWLGVFAQWTQMTSDDLELPFAEAIVKHQGNWYIGTAGGVFKSTDAGLNWTLVNNNLYDVYNRLRLEGMVSVGNTLLGANRWEGIVLTTDGSSWSLPTSGLPADYYMTELLGVVGTRIIALIMDYDTGDYALYYSTNEGVNWTKGADLTSANRDVYLYSADSKVYIVHEDVSGNDVILGETVDGVTVSAPAFTPAYPGTSIENIVKSGDYLIVGGESSIYRYDLINDGWEDLSGNWTGIAFIAAGGNNVDRLYATVLDLTMAVGSYTSADHGSTWTSITPPLVTGKSFAMSIYATGSEFMSLYIDDGIHYTADAGTTIVRRNNGALATDFEDICVSGSNILASMFVSGVYASSNDGAAWSLWNTGLPASTLQHVSDYMSDGTALFANFYIFPDDNPEPYKVVKSTNNGATWSEVAFPGTQDNLELIGVNGNTLFANSTTGGDKYYTSDNSGVSWTEITSNMPSDFMPVQVRGDGTTAYLVGFETTSGSNYLRVYTSTDNGATAWMLQMNGITLANLDGMDTDDDIHIVTPATGVAFLQIRYQGWDNRLLRWSTDTWEEATATGVNNLDLESIAYNNGVLYVSTWNSGVYRSEDAGDSFTAMAGLPAGLSAEVIAFKGNQVIITTSRGIWTYTESSTNIGSEVKNGQLLYPNPATDVVTLGVMANAVEVYALSGQLVKTLKVESNQIGIDELNKGVYIVVIQTETNKYTVKLIKN